MRPFLSLVCLNLLVVAMMTDAFAFRGGGGGAAYRGGGGAAYRGGGGAAYRGGGGAAYRGGGYRGGVAAGGYRGGVAAGGYRGDVYGGGYRGGVYGGGYYPGRGLAAGATVGVLAGAAASSAYYPYYDGQAYCGVPNYPPC